MEWLQHFYKEQQISTGHTVVPFDLGKSFEDIGHNPFSVICTWEITPPISRLLESVSTINVFNGCGKLRRRAV
jgi:hypothetical protein